MAFNLGDIFVTFKGRTEDLKRSYTDVKTKTQEIEKKINKVSFRDFSNNASSSFNSVANTIQGVVSKVFVLATASSVGIGTFIKSAAELQQTSKSFEVLTGNVDVANKLFAQLAEYAATTPFEFPDIAKAGQTLLGFGIEADKVFDNVLMLGDIAAATGADFSSLALVFGQVNATGKLMGQDALQLINNRIPITSILAKKLGITVQEVKQNMEDGAISTDLFNEALRETTQKGGFAFKGTDQLAKTLNGRLSTLKDTVLEFGRNLLGVKVDPKLGLVIKEGGLFDRFSQLVPRITKALSDLAPKAESVVNFLLSHGDDVKSILIGIGTAFIFAKGAAIAFKLAAMAADGVLKRNLIAAGLTLLISVLVALQDRFDWVGKAAAIFNDIVRVLGEWLEVAQRELANFGNSIADVINGALSWMGDRINDLISLWNDLMAVVDKVITAIEGWVEKHKQAIINWSIVIGTILLPKIVQIGVKFTVAAAKAVASFATMAASAAVESAKTTASWVASAATTVFHWVTKTLPSLIAGFARMAFSAGVNAAKAAASFVASSIQTLASWGVTFAGYLAKVAIMVVQTAIAAGKMVLSWMLALGPIGLIAAAVIGLTALIIANWDTVKGWLEGFWGWLSGSANSAWKNVKGAFSGMVNFFSGIINGIIGMFRDIGNVVGNAIGGAFKGVINGILGFAQDQINGFIRAVNFAVDVINNIPGIDIGRMAELNLPRLAMGTPDWRGGLANMNEFGPETAVLPKGTRVITADETRRNDKRSSGDNIHIHLDGIITRSTNDLADIIEDGLQEVDRRRYGNGKPLIMGGRV